MSNIYSISFSSVATVAAAVELFDVKGSTLSNFRLTSLTFGQIAAALSSSAIESLAVGVYRGSTLSSSATGLNFTTVNPVNLDSQSEATARLTAIVNSSLTGSSGAAASLLLSQPWNTQTTFVWKPRCDKGVDERPTMALGERLQVRLGAPAAAIIVGGTMVVEEIGRVPGFLTD